MITSSALVRVFGGTPVVVKYPVVVVAGGIVVMGEAVSTGSGKTPFSTLNVSKLRGVVFSVPRL